MPSPFPGMNPYLEQPDVWVTFHAQSIAVMAERLSSQVRPDYLVHIEAHLWIREMPEDKFDDSLRGRRLIGRGDLALSQDEAGPHSGGAGLDAGDVLLAPPARVALRHVDIERQRFIEIRDRRNRALVAVVELLSPSNKKPGPDRDQYVSKRSEILAGPAHFVEIDLLRCGPPMPDEDRPDTPYGVLVSRAEERPRAGFWPIGLRDPLPVVPVPLRETAEARLDLLEILHHVYDHGTYAQEIYGQEPDPPLEPDDREWARRFISGEPASG